MRTVHPKAVELAQALRRAGFVDPKTVYSHLHRRYQKGESIFKLQQDYLAAKDGGKGIFHRYTDRRAGGRWYNKFEVQAENPTDLRTFLEGWDTYFSGEVPSANVRFSPSNRIMTITWTE